MVMYEDLQASPSAAPRLVYLEDPEARHGKWFPVVEREGTTDRHGRPMTPDQPQPGERYAWIMDGSLELKRSAYRIRLWTDPGRPDPSPWGMMVWARNRTQIKEFLLDEGHNVQFGGRILRPNRRENEMTRLGETTQDDLIASAQATLERAQAQAAALIEAAARRLERLTSLPREPMPTEERPTPVILFTKTFGGGRTYDYAAIRAGNGRWSTTGPKSPKDYSWVELVQWILDGEDSVEVRVATGWGDL